MLGMAVTDKLGKFDLAFGGRSKAGPNFEDLLKGFDHRFRPMTEQERSPGTHVIDIGVPVHIDHP